MFPVRANCFTHNAAAPLTPDPGWLKLPAGLVLDRVVGVAVDRRGFVYFAHRGERPLLRLNPDGTLDREIGAGVMKQTTAYDLRGPTPIPIATKCWLHGLSVDAHDNVWVTDVGRHLVMKFSPSGDLLMTLGVDGQTGCDDTKFNQPTHVCVLPSGDFLVTDGYGNSRVAKFNASGRFLLEWGKRGTEPGEFHTPHVVVRDSLGRIYISDRENDRIQLFDENGKVLAVWDGLHSVDGLHVARDGAVLASSGIDNAIIRLHSRGRITHVWATPDQLRYPHALATDATGALLVAETGDIWRVTGSGPNDRYPEPRNGPEGSRLLRLSFPALD
jgi:hypothetical protein